MLRLLRLISARHLSRHRLRTLLTFLGIAFGVAVIIAIAVVNRALIVSFQSTIDQVAGKAVLQVSNAESGIPESILPAVRDAYGVKGAAPAVEGFAPVVGVRGERLYVYGVDLLTDSSVRDYEFTGPGFAFDQALDFIANSDSIAITETLSRRLNLPLGSSLTLATSAGRQTFTVRAGMREEGTAKVFGGSFALMDLPVAQRIFGKKGKLDVIDLTVEPGVSVEAVQRRLKQVLGGAAEVERPQKRGEQIELLLTSFRVGLFFVSLIALFVGFFLIYNTVAVSIVQRKHEIGTLRCLGMRRGELLRLILAEALLLALAASVVGVGLGWLIAKAALFAVGETVANLFSAIDLRSAAVNGYELLVALASGTIGVVLAALFPAWEAIHLSPLESVRQAAWRPGLRERSLANRLGFACLLGSPVLLLLAPWVQSPVESFSIGVSGMLVFLLALAFFSPALIKYTVNRFWRSAVQLPGLSWAESRLASDSLRRNPVRSGITVATMVISLAAIFTIAAFVSSVRGSLLAWADQMVPADLLVAR